MKILLTGGAGYIGSHASLALIDAGHEVTIIDNLSTGNINLLPKKAKFIECNINNEEVLNNLLKENSFDALMHFAGYVQVEESVKNPEKYFNNNTENAIKLFEVCIGNNLKNFIFSSTAAAYGNPINNNQIIEETSLNPINPYGESKIQTEKYLREKLNIKYIILRYFNVAGADPLLRTGLLSKKATHLIKITSEVAVGKREKITIFGNDYPTKDGTAVRDYIHVSDLADIHVQAAKFLLSNKRSEIINCGYGNGFSVKEVIEVANELNEKKINFEIGKRRIGDPAMLVSNITKLKSLLKWEPKYNNLSYIIRTSIDWEKKIIDTKYV
jgi:UDP-glucose 4-epimerase